MSWLDKYIVNGFLGWENIKWFCREVLKTWSGEPSFFSRKRIESCLLFGGAFGSLLRFTVIRIEKGAPYEEMLTLTGAMFVYAGYTMSIIQKEKAENKAATNNEPKD